MSRAESNELQSVCAGSGIQAAEWVALGFFAYLAGLGILRPVGLAYRALLVALPLGLMQFWRLEGACSTRASRIVRQWSSLALILIGYWFIQCFATAPIPQLQERWVAWDRGVLYTAGLDKVIEAAGSLVPSVLEDAYLLLYSIPPVSLGLIYALGARSKANRYITILFLGTFSAYALLPWFPVSSPRVAFPGQDLPRFAGFARGANTWLLDHLDISTSVFPSGHVAVAFSSAFGLFSTLRARRWIWTIAFLTAALVYVATVYGRYHYAVDGAASIMLAAVSWAVHEVWVGLD